MRDQQPTPTFFENISLEINPMASVLLDPFVGGKTMCLATDDNTLIDHQISCYSQTRQRAEDLYRSVRFAGQISRFLSWLFHQPTHLMEASEVIDGEIVAYNFPEMKSVWINQIVASEKRYNDFDFAFNPLNDKNWNDWINMAVLMLLGVDLPPVDLLQIDNNYIVRDGHNRISVSCTLGMDRITACVTHPQHRSEGS
jgi:hypothetical protein